MNWNKKLNEKIQKIVHNSFLPVDKYLGEENMINVDVLYDNVIAQLHLKANKMETQYIKARITNFVFGQMMNEKSRFYIEGLAHIKKNRKAHYFICRSVEEINKSKRVLDYKGETYKKSAIIHQQIRKEHLTEIGFKDKKNIEDEST